MTNKPLTDAQERVVAELALGYDPPEIAVRLNLSVHTVRCHIETVADALGGDGRPIRRVRRWAIARIRAA